MNWDHEHKSSTKRDEVFDEVFMERYTYSR